MNYWTRRCTNVLFILAFLSVVLLQQICVPGNNQIPIQAPVFIGLVFLAVFLGLTRIPKRENSALFIMLGLGTASVVVSAASSSSRVSLESYFYFLVLYSAFAVHSKQDAEVGFAKLGKIGIVFALIGIFQQISQRFGFGYFELFEFLPKNLQLDGFNISYDTSYDSGIKKSNGFFFLEPSFYSQFMALLFIIEFHSKRRPVFLFIYLLAFLSAYSGSGFIILMMWGAYILFVSKYSIYVKVGVLISILIVVFAAYIALPEVTKRVSEVLNEGTSGYVRYTAPVLNYLALQENFGWREFAFGMGPGASDDFKNYVSSANYPSVIKALIEYGAPFTISYIVWWWIYIKRNILPYLRLPVVGFIFIASSTFLQPMPLMTVWFFSFFNKEVRPYGK